MSKLLFDPSVRASGNLSGTSPTEAVVVDVIRNEEHPDYNQTGFNVGAIRFRYTEQGSYNSTDSIDYYAIPMDITIQEYPLIGEIVSIQKLKGVHFYNKRVNVNKSLIYNSFKGIQSRLKRPPGGEDRSQRIEMIRRGGTNRSSIGTQPEEELRDENYVPRPFLHNLKHFDGDVIFQNRFGSSIRLGSSQMEDALNQKVVDLDGKRIIGPATRTNNPLIIFRVGESDTSLRTNDTKYALTVEDVNLDSSTLLLASNQRVDFLYATSNKPNHYRSNERLGIDYIRPGLDSRSPLSGNQGIFNSGRLVFNSKETDIIQSANRDIVSLSNRNITSDAGQDNILSSGRDIILSPEEGYVVLGKLNEGRGTQFTRDPLGQPQGNDTYLSAALAEPLIEILDRLINLLTPTSAPGIGIAVSGQPIIPVWNTQMKILSKQLNKIRSDLVRIEK